MLDSSQMDFSKNGIFIGKIAGGGIEVQSNGTYTDYYANGTAKVTYSVPDKSKTVLLK